MVKRIIYYLLVVLTTGTKLCAQTDTLFWFVAPTISSGHCAGATCPGGQPILFRISTMSIPATVTISEPANPAFIPIILNIPANTTVSQDVSSRIAMIENVPANTILDYGIQIRSTNLITVYYECNQWYNPEFFALKGKNALGTKFYISSQNTWNNGSYTPTPYSSFEIVATEDNTTITITPSNAIVGHAAGVPFTITLNRGQTYSATATSQLAANHLMGSKVESDKPIAITISDDSVAKDGCRDLIGDQTIPVTIIGKEYIIMKGQITTDERFFVLATENNTDVFVNGVYVTTLNEGQTYSYIITAPTHVGATLPVYVYHVAGFQCEFGSAILPPIDQCTGSTQVGFTRSINQDFYLNIMVRAGAEDGFILNGNGPNTVIPASAFSAVPGTTQWTAAVFNFTAGTTVPTGTASLISNTKDLFHLGIINGSSSVGCRYGYFSDFNVLQINAIVAGTGSDVIKRCYGESAQLIATGGTNYEWSPAADLDNPFISTPTASPLETTKYTVTVSGACNMTDSASVTVYVAPPLLANFAIEHTQGCTPFTTDITNSSLNVTNYSWHLGDGDTSTFSGTQFSHTYVNYTANPDTSDLQLIVTNIYDCTDTLTRTIITYPAVDADFSASPITGCNPLLVTYTNNSAGATYYDWSYGDGGTSNQADSAHEFVNLGTNDTTYNTVLIATSQYFCNDTVQRSITVAPYLKADFSVEYISGCTPFVANIYNSSVGATLYTWNFGDGFTSGSSGPVITHTFINTTSSPVDFTIKLVVKNNHNCMDSITRIITVYPTVTSGFTAVPGTGCNPLNVNFTNTSTGASGYEWLYGDGGSSSFTDTTHLFENLHTHDTIYNTQLIAISQYNCRDTSAINIEVYSYLKADFSFQYSSGCSPFIVSIDNASIGAASYLWDFGDGNTSATSAANIIHTYNNTTNNPVTYQITLIVYNIHNCTDTLRKTLTVNPAVVSDFTAFPDSGCNPLYVNFTNNSTGAVTHEWIYGDGTSSGFFDSAHTYTNYLPGNTIFITQLVAISPYFCSDTSSVAIQVAPYLKAGFDFEYNSGCTPFAATINNTSIGATSYQWTLGDGTFSDTSVATFSHIFTNNTDSAIYYFVELLVQNAQGCYDTIRKPITVYPAVFADFNINPDSGCNPLAASFINNSTGAITYNWTFGDGGSSSLISPSHIFQHSGENDTLFNVGLIASSQFGCHDTAAWPVTVFSYLKANFTLDYTSGCSPFTAVIHNNSTGAINYNWSFSDGDSSSASSVLLNHIYTNTTGTPQTFLIELIVQNAHFCPDTLVVPITVNPSVTSDFTAYPVIGCNPLTVDFTNNSVGTSSYEWIYGDGGTSFFGDTSHIFQNLNNYDTTYTVQMVATSQYNCKDTASLSITIYSYLNTDFTFEYSQGCSPFNAVITNSSQGAINYQWDFGDGVTSTSANTIINHLYNNITNNPIIRTVELIVTNSHFCLDTLIREITIFPPVISYFTATPVYGCNPLSVNFTNYSTNATDFTWEYGDGGSSGITNPSHIFSNLYPYDTTFTTELIAISPYGCKDMSALNIIVYSRIQADFSFEYSSGCSPFVVGITNSSTGAATYQWDFGNGNFSTTSAAFFNYTYENFTNNPDTNTIRLIVQNAYGCPDTLARDLIVYPNAVSSFSVTPTENCSPLHAVFTNQSTGASTYMWEFGDGGSSGDQEPAHNYTNLAQHDTAYTVSLYAFSPYNCSDTSSASITVYSHARAFFAIDNNIVCAQRDVLITDLSTGASHYFWDFGDGTTSDTSGQEFYHHYENLTGSPVVYTITLIVENPASCNDTFMRQVTVYPGVTAAFGASPASGCSPLPVHFTNQSAGASDYFWSFGDGFTSYNENPVHMFYNLTANDTSFDIMLIAISPYLCSDTSQITVIIRPAVTASFTVEPSEGCTPFLATIHNLSSGEVHCLWDFGDGTTSSSTDSVITHLYNNNTNALFVSELILSVTNTYGCSAQVSQTISVYPEITASFICDTSGCTPFSTTFVNTSAVADYMLWDFGDGDSSTVYHPNHLYINNTTQNLIFTVTLIAESQYGCRDTFMRPVTIYPSPDASFTVTPEIQTFPSNTVNIINNTAGNWNYLWTFGDGDTSYSANPSSHFYDTWGAYTIRLYVSNGYCSDTMSRTIQILSTPPVTYFTPSVDHGCPPLVVSFTNSSLYGNIFAWDFGDGGTSTLENPTHTFYEPGTDTVKLTVTGSGGQTRYFKTITVYPLPHAFFQVEPQVVTIPDEYIICHNQSDLAVSYLWDFGDGGSSELENPIHYYTKEGEFDISLIVWSVNNCMDTLTLAKAVRAKSECKVLFPNAFTPSPNGSTGGYYPIPDHTFDVFHPLFRVVTDYQLEIFNRWGELLFISKDAAIGWDGYYRGELCKQEVYVWKARWKCTDGSTQTLAGDVTLLR
ncbi:MAG: PKD domain-containing protein [Bacteroidia bacterium]|nr:PKD domain-containing protein [Bacteroidia bacterium]